MDDCTTFDKKVESFEKLWYSDSVLGNETEREVFH